MSGGCRLAVAVLAVLLGSASVASADRETAEFFAKRGDRLLKQSDASGAAAEFAKSVAEDEAFVPGRVGLGEAYAALGRKAEAAEELRAAIALAEKATGALPLAWSEAVARARKRLAEVDAAGGTIEKIQRRYADDLVALADRWKSKDALVAERALRLALQAVPGHPEASKRLEGLGSSGATPVVVFDGKSFDRFVPGEDDDVWRIANGILRGSVAKAAKALQTGRIFDPDVTVRMEVRMTAKLGDSPKFGILAAASEDQAGLFFGVFEDTMVLDHETGGGARNRRWTTLRRNLKPPFDPSGWNKLEMRLRGDEVTLSINGAPVRRERRPKERRGGTAGVFVQDATIEVRRFEVLPL